jgi:hypothetical protein
MAPIDMLVPTVSPTILDTPGGQARGVVIAP